MMIKLGVWLSVVTSSFNFDVEEISDEAALIENHHFI